MIKFIFLQLLVLLAAARSAGCAEDYSALINSLENSSPEQREKIMSALAGEGDAIEPALHGCLAKNDDTTKSYCLNLVDKAGLARLSFGAEAREISGTQDPDLQKAIISLAGSDPCAPDFRQALRTLTGSADGGVAAAATGALGRACEEGSVFVFRKTYSFRFSFPGTSSVFSGLEKYAGKFFPSFPSGAKKSGVSSGDAGGGGETGDAEELLKNILPAAAGSLPQEGRPEQSREPGVADAKKGPSAAPSKPAAPPAGDLNHKDKKASASHPPAQAGRGAPSGKIEIVEAAPARPAPAAKAEEKPRVPAVSGEDAVCRDVLLMLNSQASKDITEGLDLMESLGPQGACAVKKLDELYWSDRPLREKILEVLKAMGKNAAPAFADILARGGRREKLIVLNMAVELGDDAAPLSKQILKLTESDDPEIRAAAKEAMRAAYGGITAL
jgi:hypothetical protein